MRIRGIRVEPDRPPIRLLRLCDMAGLLQGMPVLDPYPGSLRRLAQRLSVAACGAFPVARVARAIASRDPRSPAPTRTQKRHEFAPKKAGRGEPGAENFMPEEPAFPVRIERGATHAFRVAPGGAPALPQR